MRKLVRQAFEVFALSLIIVALPMSLIFAGVFWQVESWLERNYFSSFLALWLHLYLAMIGGSLLIQIMESVKLLRKRTRLASQWNISKQEALTLILGDELPQYTKWDKWNAAQFQEWRQRREQGYRWT